jgi:hypothetical protein
MSFLNDVLEQYNRNLHQQGLRTRMFENEMCAHDEALRVFYSIQNHFIIEYSNFVSLFRPSRKPSKWY